MDEIWERAVEAALDGQKDVAAVRSLTLDGAVKCLHGRLPQPALFEKFQNLQHFSIANIGVASLEQFPRLRNLQRLILSDNRISGGLEFLVEAGLGSLRDLDLSNNRISDINDLRPLAELKLVSLDLYECPVTRIKEYRAQVFGLIKSLKYLDKMDVDENERPESEEEEEDEEEEYDPGSGEVDGEDHMLMLNNGDQAGMEGVLNVDEDEESDADEEETETPSVVNGLVTSDSHPHSNGFEVVAVDGEDDDDDDEGEEEDDLVDEVYEDDEGEDEDVVEVHEIDDSEDEDGVEYDEDDDEDEDVEYEVNHDGRDLAEAGSTGRLTSTEGEIDAHEQGEDDVDEDDNGETGEEEHTVEENADFDDDDEEEDYGDGYLVQPIGRAEAQTGGDMDPGDEDEVPEIEEDLEEEYGEEDLDGEIQELPSSSSHKRKRSEDSHDDEGEEDDEGEDDEGEDDDVLPHSKSSKHH